MAPNSLFAFALFLSSYAPAFLILAVRAFDRSSVLCWTFLGLGVGSGLLFLAFIKVARKGAPFKADIVEVEPRDSDIAAYVATYLLPFLLVFDVSAQDVIALGLFLFFIGLLWVSSGLVYLNPLLTLVGYHIYIAKVQASGAPASSAFRAFVLTPKRDLRVGDEIQPDRLGHGVLIDLAPRSDDN